MIWSAGGFDELQLVYARETDAGDPQADAAVDPAGRNALSREVRDLIFHMVGNIRQRGA
jgi:hypothetical protein